MLVRLQFGPSRGDVVDFLPHEAHAMLADGRATLPESASPTVVSVSVAEREDRVAPGAKRRRTR
jgi:hypothetical protein